MTAPSPQRGLPPWPPQVASPGGGTRRSLRGAGKKGGGLSGLEASVPQRRHRP